MPRLSSRPRVHPSTCTCRMCKKHKKERRKETRRAIGTIYVLFAFVLIIGAL